MPSVAVLLTLTALYGGAGFIYLAVHGLLREWRPCPPRSNNCAKTASVWKSFFYDPLALQRNCDRGKRTQPGATAQEWQTLAGEAQVLPTGPKQITVPGVHCGRPLVAIVSSLRHKKTCILLRENSSWWKTCSIMPGCFHRSAGLPRARAAAWRENSHGREA